MGRKSKYKALASVSPLVSQVIDGEWTFTGRLDELLGWMENGQVTDLFKYYCRDLDTLNNCPLKDIEVHYIMHYYETFSEDSKNLFTKTRKRDALVGTGIYGVGEIFKRIPRYSDLGKVFKLLGGAVLCGTGGVTAKYFLDEKQIGNQIQEWTDSLYKAAETLDAEVQDFFFSEEE